MERGKGDLSESRPLFSPPENSPVKLFHICKFHKIPVFGFDFVFYPALLIQKVQDTQFGLNEINDRLVIAEVDHCPGDPFSCVFFLV